MKESVERIRREGHSDRVADIARSYRIQQWSQSLLKSCDGRYLNYYRHGHSCWLHEGIVEKSSVIVQLALERVVEVSVDSRELLRVNHATVNGIEHNQVLDLSDDGERWEGDVLNDEPYGWGVLYDKDNNRVYEGFRIGDVNVCYGMRYYPDIQKVEYQGEIWEGRRWGRGVQYDRAGSVVFVGEWLNDEHSMEKKVKFSDSGLLLHEHIEELDVVLSDTYEWGTLDLSCFPNLRVFEAGQCLSKVREVRLIGLKHLERALFYFCSFSDVVGRFYLKDCVQLKELFVSSGSFSIFSVCELENLPSLEEITVGDKYCDYSCFSYASLVLKGMLERGA